MHSKFRTIQTIARYFSFAKVLLLGFVILIPPISASQELSRCGRAVLMASKKTFEGRLNSQHCPISARLVEWMQLQNSADRSRIPFSRLISFLMQNPNWPRKHSLQIQAEKNLSGGESNKELRKWFDENPPLTARGAIFYARALIKAKRMNSAKKEIQSAWTRFELKGGALKSFWKEFKKYLTKKDHVRRVDRLLMEEKVSDAKRMFPWLDKSHKALVDARIALIKKAGDVDSKLSKVPKSLVTDPGLIYDRIKWHRRKEHNSKMLKLLMTHPQRKEDKPLWWRERNLLIRRLMDEHKYQDAYNLAKAHGLSSGENFANGEWLAGWIALRKLNRPGIALVHFETLSKRVKTPISSSRAAYWASRAATQMGKKEAGNTWLAKAKLYPGTYYGQVALRGSVNGPTPPLHSKRPNINSKLHQKFEKRELVQVIRILCGVGAKHLIGPFAAKLSQELTNPAEQIFLIELAAKDCGPYFGVLASKKLPMKNVPLIDAAYPKLSRHLQNKVNQNPALVHAIIRQESRFKADARSPAGAQGLMQLMPKTALQTAKLQKTRLGSLSDPNVNIPLGCAHLRLLLDQYKGSMVLSIAAYNAGKKAVDSWLQQYGDPRQQGVDLIDWIETIPYAETRNYVQRVLENYAFYVQRLGK